MATVASFSNDRNSSLEQISLSLNSCTTDGKFKAMITELALDTFNPFCYKDPQEWLTLMPFVRIAKLCENPKKVGVILSFLTKDFHINATGINAPASWALSEMNNRIPFFKNVIEECRIADMYINVSNILKRNESGPFKDALLPNVKAALSEENKIRQLIYLKRREQTSVQFV